MLKITPAGAFDNYRAVKVCKLCANIKGFQNNALKPLLGVVDLLGRKVLTVQNPESEIDLAKLPTGIYLVKVYFKECVGVYRVVKN